MTTNIKALVDEFVTKLTAALDEAAEARAAKLLTDVIANIGKKSEAEKLPRVVYEAKPGPRQYKTKQASILGTRRRWTAPELAARTGSTLSAACQSLQYHRAAGRLNRVSRGVYEVVQ